MVFLKNRQDGWLDPLDKEPSEAAEFQKLSAQASTFWWLTDPVNLQKDFLGCGVKWNGVNAV